MINARKCTYFLVKRSKYSDFFGRCPLSFSQDLFVIMIHNVFFAIASSRISYCPKARWSTALVSVTCMAYTGLWEETNKNIPNKIISASAFFCNHCNFLWINTKNLLQTATLMSLLQPICCLVKTIKKHLSTGKRVAAFPFILFQNSSFGKLGHLHRSFRLLV